jgi:hypothetical protein
VVHVRATQPGAQLSPTCTTCSHAKAQRILTVGPWAAGNLQEVSPAGCQEEVLGHNGPGGGGGSVFSVECCPGRIRPDPGPSHGAVWKWRLPARMRVDFRSRLPMCPTKSIAWGLQLLSQEWHPRRPRILADVSADPRQSPILSMRCTADSQRRFRNGPRPARPAPAYRVAAGTGLAPRPAHRLGADDQALAEHEARADRRWPSGPWYVGGQKRMADKRGQSLDSHPVVAVPRPTCMSIPRMPNI